MNTVAIIQARMGSSRLPGKVLEPINGQPVLARIIDRLGRCSTLSAIVVATSTQLRDDGIALLAERAAIRVYRGSEEDVLSRYIAAAKEAGADAVVRITADCPLIDPGVVDRVVRALHRRYDFVSNAVERTYPWGLDVEALWMDTLLRLDRRATTPQEREHVTWGAYKTEPALYRTRIVTDDEDNSDLRWTLDTKADLEHIREIYDDVDYRTLIGRCRKERIA